ncbi:MAG: hypothetical protein GX036_10425 [Firmicutes bacterium]|nr:hypothetical protein [Bacillota bacterium]
MQPFAEVIFRCLKEENYLKNLDPDNFSKKTDYYFSAINELHPFREGNGRAQREFIRQLALNAGYILDFSEVTAREMLEASIKSHYGLNGFERLIKQICRPVDNC